MTASRDIRKVRSLVPRIKSIGQSLADMMEETSMPCPATGCRLWLGPLTNKGYGTLSWKGRKNLHAHRIAYELAYGPLPSGKHALHRCDMRCCVEPLHLFAGTKGDNNTDRHKKGRSAIIVGVQRYNAKLTDGAIRAIRTSDERNSVLAERYGVSQPIISQIRSRKRWKHVL